MKKLIIAILLFPLISFSQDYSEVVQVEGKNLSELYTSAREWFALTFKSANDVIQMDDPVSGKLIGKGSTHVSENYISGKGLMAVPIAMEWYPNFTIKVEVREGRYKCDITDITIKSTSEYLGTVETSYQSYLEMIDFYKNASDPDWLMQNPPEGHKVGKSLAKATSQAYAATYKMILQTDENIKAIMEDLQKSMKTKSNNDW